MHFEIGGKDGLPAAISGLADAPDTQCVAACYRCLMSYFNQPDHELLDRRDDDAKQLLLRLARSVTTLTPRESGTPQSVPMAKEPVAPGLAGWSAAARARGIPAPDAVPLTSEGVQVPLVWKNHYVAASIGPLDATAANRLADLGFDLITFGASEQQWGEPFARLAKALGRS
jgi:hypothetical protein